MPEQVYSDDPNRISITLARVDVEHQTLSLRISKVRIYSI